MIVMLKLMKSSLKNRSISTPENQMNIRMGFIMLGRYRIRFMCRGSEKYKAKQLTYQFCKTLHMSEHLERGTFLEKARGLEEICFICAD